MNNEEKIYIGTNNKKKKKGQIKPDREKNRNNRDIENVVHAGNECAP